MLEWEPKGLIEEMREQSRGCLRQLAGERAVTAQSVATKIYFKRFYRHQLEIHYFRKKGKPAMY